MRAEELPTVDEGTSVTEVLCPKVEFDVLYIDARKNFRVKVAVRFTSQTPKKFTSRLLEAVLTFPERQKGNEHGILYPRVYARKVVLGVAGHAFYHRVLSFLT
jgi:hypothetical protein